MQDEIYGPHPRWDHDPEVHQTMTWDTGDKILTDEERDIFVHKTIRLMNAKFKRDEAESWANNLKLVAFDDPEHEPTLTSAEAATTAPWHVLCTRCEYGVINVTGHHCEAHSANQRQFVLASRETRPSGQHPGIICDVCDTTIGHGERFRCLRCSQDFCRRCIEDESCHHDQLKHFPAVCKHIAGHYCGGCLKNVPISPFPASSRVKRLRIVQQSEICPEDYAKCKNFVAVSYQWKAGQPSGMYRVRDIDGGYRPSNAPDDVLARVIDFARENGFRFFWIDQECINQDDNSDEKDLAVDSMDLVYAKAELTVGILDTALSSHNELVALSNIYNANMGLEKHVNESGESLLPSHLANLQQMLWQTGSANLALNFFERISQEGWCTRGWILQESYSAGIKMCLLFRNPDKLELRGTKILCEDRAITGLVFDLERLVRCITFAKRLFRYDGTLDTSLPEDDYNTFLRENDERITRVMGRLDDMFMRPNDIPANVPYVQGPYDTPGSTAARAWSHLRHRRGKFIRDWPTILANLCRFRIRLKFSDLEGSQSLCAAIIGTSLANGDFSLLVPEVYKTLSTILPSSGDGITLNPRDRHTWLPPVLRLEDASYVSPNSPLIKTPSTLWHHTLTDRGLSFPGVLWKVEEYVDFTTIQLAFADKWFTLKFWLAYLDGNVGKDPSSWLPPWFQTFTQLPDPTQASLEPLRFQMELLSQELHEQVELPEEDIATLRHQLHDFLYEIFLAILVELRDVDQLQMADAIWNSIQGPSWHGPGDFAAEGEVPRSVKHFPQDCENLLTMCGRDLFQFDQCSRSSNQQDWLLERIMIKGWVLCGRPVMSTAEDEWFVEENGRRYKDQDPTWNEDKAAVSRSTNPKIVKPSGCYHPDNTAAFAMHLFQSVLSEKDPARASLGSINEPSSDAGAFMAFMQSLSHATSSGRIHGELPDHRAFFDVSDPGYVLTPHQPFHDIMPRPAVRSMSVSWRVETISPGNGKGRQLEQSDADPGKVEEEFKAFGQVRGMWAVTTMPPSKRYRIK